MRLTLLLFLTFISLYGRDNPFFPSDPNEKQMQSTNRVETLKPYSQQQISLPNSARVIKAIIIRYQNLDGSISNEQLHLNNSIDWHEPLVVSQGENKSVPMIKKIKTETKKVQTKKTKTKTKKSKSVESKSVGTKFIKFRPVKKSMKIVTKDKMLRNFMLASPARIVLDFARDTSFKPKNYEINQIPYTKIRMGNHDKYYRVVIELDGQYKYKLETSDKDYTIVCY